MDILNQENTQQVTYPQKHQSQVLLMILLGVIMLIIGFYGGYLFFANKDHPYRSNNQVTRVVTPTIQETPSTNNQTQLRQVSTIKAKDRKLLQERKIDGGRLAAYRLNDDWSYDVNGGVFAIVLESGEYNPVIFSTVNPAYADEHVFELVKDKLWVANAQTNKIDIYSIQTEKTVNNVTQLSEITYNKSIDLPQAGRVYSIVCNTATCTVQTAYHLESGCSLEININSESISTPKCW